MHKHEYKGKRGDVLYDTKVQDEAGSNILIPRKTFREYLTPYFWSALDMFYLTENMKCLPFGGGWAEQPEEITVIINLFRIEQSKIEEEKWKKDRHKD